MITEYISFEETEKKMIKGDSEKILCEWRNIKLF